MIIVLFQPQIPANTGNIVRTCHATGSELILVAPLGFKTDNKSLKRAGLDYWEGVKVTIINDLSAYLMSSSLPFYFFSSKGEVAYSHVAFEEDAILIFGSEVSGLAPEFYKKWPEKFFTIPMQKGSRCLNLSNSVAIVLYEGLRQNGFTVLKKERVGLTT